MTAVGGEFEFPVHALMPKDLSFTGMGVYNTPDSDAVVIARWLGQRLVSGAISPVIRREFPLAAAAEAHELVSRPGAAGKIMLVP